jgi:hypothetical protein
MARRKPDRSTERGERRAETNAVAAYMTAMRAPKTPARNPAKPVERRAQIEQWLSDGDLSPIEELRLVQRRLDIDADLARLDQADRLPELEEAFVNVAASWCNTTRSARPRGATWACQRGCWPRLGS